MSLKKLWVFLLNNEIIEKQSIKSNRLAAIFPREWNDFTEWINLSEFPKNRCKKAHRISVGKETIYPIVMVCCQIKRSIYYTIDFGYIHISPSTIFRDSFIISNRRPEFDYKFYNWQSKWQREPFNFFFL